MTVQAMEIEEVIELIKLGLTPKVVEHAYSNSGVRELASRFEESGVTIQSLAARWGIKDYVVPKKQ